MSLLHIRSPRRHLSSRVPPALLLTLAAIAGCAKPKNTRLPIETAAVVRRTIVSEATASGSVEAINVVDVRSKSSGQITEMPVETGTQVKKGDLIVQLDTRDVQNQYDQAKADLDAAQSKSSQVATQLKRQEQLFKERIITAPELETAQLDSTNSRAALIRAQASLDLALQRLQDATIRAPSAGTIIAKPVSLGQVIASATSSASGGTSIVQMADLHTVRVRANFNETDIANVHAQQEATLTVDAYPDRPFRGVVEKIEPVAVVVQSVTFFPVLVTLDNSEGLLKPGMNGEVSVLVDTREDVLVVPNDAIRTTREAVTTARLLGLNPDSVSASVQEQQRAMMGGGGFNGGGGGGRGGRSGDSAAAKKVESKGEVASNADLGQGGQGGAPDMQRNRAVSDSIYKALGLDAQVARACAFRERMQSGGFGGGQRGSGGQGSQRGLGGNRQRGQQGMGGQGQSAQSGQGGQGGGRRGGMNLPQVTDQDCAKVKATLAKNPKAEQMLAAMRGQGGQGAQSGPAGQLDQTTGTQRGRTSVQSGRGGGASAPVRAGEFSAQRNRTRPSLVYVAEGTGYVPRVIRSGLSDLDYTEVISGLQEGERVLLLAAVQLQAQRDSANARAKQMQGLPGMTKGGTVPGGGGGPGGGGRRGGD